MIERNFGLSSEIEKPEPPALDVLSTAAKIEAEAAGGAIQKDPRTFKEMLDPRTGNLLQRIIKVYITPHKPERTVKLMEDLGVDRFQKLLLGIYRLITNATGFDKRIKNERIQTNYTLGDRSLDSMVDFATNQTTFNEVLHLIGAAWCAAVFLPEVAAGNFEWPVVLSMSLFIVNIYCILAQRYTRARLSIAIDRALKLGKPFVGKYENILGIRIPSQDHTRG